MLQMDLTTDLETTVAFVIRRIEEQAMRSGQPLNEEERSLLNDLPGPQLYQRLAALSLIR
jgi:hypothetical protein